MRSGVYRITNTVSGKIYIGSAADIKGRWAAHRSALSRGIHENRFLQSAWKKHGPQAFSFEIIELIPEADLLAREQHWIDNSSCRLGLGGYNISPSAGTCRGVKHSPETRARMSAAKKGRPSPRRGVPLSLETKAKVSAAHKAIAQTPEWKLSQAKRVEAAKAAEARKKNSLSKKGGKISPEIRAKMAKAHRDFWSKEEPEREIRRSRVGQAWKGKSRPDHSLKLKGRACLEKRALTYEIAEEIRVKKSEGRTYSELAVTYGLNRCSIHRIVHRETYASPE